MGIKLLLATFMFIFILCYPLLFFSHTLKPSGFYGTIKINATDAPAGSIITPTIAGTEYASSFYVEISGQYGLLFVNGDDLSTPGTKEGGVNGETVIFKVQIGETQHELIPTGNWSSGTNQELNLTNESEIPVELSSFMANTEKNTVNLFWRTESESNNFGFEIQRSEDNINFSKIVFIHGHGTTSSPHSYKYTDSSLAAGKFYYRLRQIDFDGTSNFSQVTEVTIYNPSKLMLHQNFPNPFNPTTNIQFTIPNAGSVTIDIYNFTGNLVRNLLNCYKPTGNFSIVWDGKNNDGARVSSGLYFCRMAVNEITITKKMMLTK